MVRYEMGTYSKSEMVALQGSPCAPSTRMKDNHLNDIL
jgi:hypothetical protein